jgi:hypothetical protein
VKMKEPTRPKSRHHRVPHQRIRNTQRRLEFLRDYEKVLEQGEAVRAAHTLLHLISVALPRQNTASTHNATRLARPTPSIELGRFAFERDEG